jgi:predicted tellurium resistance membrane protein TerC
MLITECAIYQMHFGSHVTPVLKGYLYFAISFSFLVEVLNMKAKKK